MEKDDRTGQSEPEAVIRYTKQRLREIDHRVIEVEPLFWRQLMEALSPVERWIAMLPDGRIVLQLWTDEKKLLLFARVKHE